MKSIFYQIFSLFFNTTAPSQPRIEEKKSHTAFDNNFDIRVNNNVQMIKTFIKEGGYSVRHVNNKFFLEKNDYLIDESIFMPWIEKRFPEFNNKK